ncbi:hypothetical protein LTS15_010780 [Exophiala xenobiotica]|nr:hypothetical protein LTS15_010780 [Exophiala xenobiotica]
MDDESFNHVLRYAFDSVRPPQVDRNSRQRHRKKQVYFVKLCEMILTKFPEKQILATTVASAVAAEGSLDAAGPL